MVRKMLAALVGLAVFGVAASASAAPITRAFTFSAVNFGNGVPGGDPAPVDPVTGTLILTFDPMNLADTTGNAVDAGSIVNLGSLGSLTSTDLLFDYTNSASDDTITVGASPLGASNIDLAMLDFLIIIESASGSPVSGTVAYSDPAANGGNGAEFASEIIQVSATQIPEPGTLALFLVALLGLGYVVTRQRQRPVAAPAVA